MFDPTFTNRDENGLETTTDGYGEQPSHEVNFDPSFVSKLSTLEAEDQ